MLVLDIRVERGSERVWWIPNGLEMEVGVEGEVRGCA